jgi:hypothetical protein
MNELYAWAAIALIILASTTGDVLLSYSMKQVGDVGELWKRRGLLAVVGRVLATPTFALGVMAMGIAFYSFGLAHLCGECAGRAHFPARTRGAPPVDCGLAGRGWRGADGGLNFT